MRARPARLALLAAACALGAAPAPASASRAGLNGPGAIKLVSSQKLDRRLTELTLRTPAIPHDTGVRVLLPDGYRAHPRERYPVLYLLHGSGGSETAWTEMGDAEKATAGRPLIVVMPDTDQNGWYTDWFNNGSYGQPMYETYDIRELIPWIDRHYRTIGARRGRAVAGLSMGGFGALSYASRHPDKFVRVAGFSPASDTNFVPFQVLHESGSSDTGSTINTWGPYATQEVIWRGHNPWDLAQNLHGMGVSLRYGNGKTGGPYGGGDPIEAGVHAMTVAYDAKLTALGIPHINDDYGPGGHAWPYWQRDLREELPLFMTAFRSPPPRPRTVDFTAIEPSYEDYGWRVHVKRPALEFSTLSHANHHGFELSGSGKAVVKTPRRFRPGDGYIARLRLQGGKAPKEELIASRDGRLKLHVPLGPGNPAQEYTSGSTTNVFTTKVRITRAN